MATQAAPRGPLLDRGQQVVLLAAVIIAAAVLLSGWISRRECTVRFETQYQAVLLSSGQVYYGRLEGYGTAHPVLREVYYVQSAAGGPAQNVTNVLLKRGGEWHGPDRMYLNPAQILLVEPVGSDSKVAGLIKELNKQQH